MEKENNPMREYCRHWFPLFLLLFLVSCEEENEKINPIISDYSGSYNIIEFSETLVGNFTPGIYRENEIPEALKEMTYGRLEIDFTYMGGALTSFMPILYYGSINKNDLDDAVEETQFHLVVEIGHYNVIPFPVENLFYTICYDRYPQYCRDTYVPVISGENYTFIIDKRPEGIILQLRQGSKIINSLPSAFFPDSANLFFQDITRKIEQYRGDSLEIVLMVEQGFVGFERGLRTFNGQVPTIRIYQYELSSENCGYEIYGIKNQHFVRQQINYALKDNNFIEGNTIRMLYSFQPYLYEGTSIKPEGEVQSYVVDNLAHDQLMTEILTTENIGYYEIDLETIGEDGGVIHSTPSPFRVWVYPESWAFDY
jgi:hypothetical protein